MTRSHGAGMGHQPEGACSIAGVNPNNLECRSAPWGVELQNEEVRGQVAPAYRTDVIGRQSSGGQSSGHRCSFCRRPLSLSQRPDGIYAGVRAGLQARWQRWVVYMRQTEGESKRLRSIRLGRSHRPARPTSHAALKRRCNPCPLHLHVLCRCPPCVSLCCYCMLCAVCCVLCAVCCVLYRCCAVASACVCVSLCRLFSRRRTFRPRTSSLNESASTYEPPRHQRDDPPPCPTPPTRRLF